MPNYKLQVEVTPQYLPEQSDPANNLYTFAYSITITNTGNIAAQVISRSWSVNDANGLH
jgi:ApaG protein